MILDSVDRQILNRLQRGIEVVDRPFAEVAEDTGLSEDAVVGRIQRLFDLGAVTRFGPMFDAQRLGGAVTLCAMSVPKEAFEQVAALANGFAEVAHNYERDHVLNMWFVVAVDDPAMLQAVIDRIETGCGFPVYDLPKLDEYYIGLHLTV